MSEASDERSSESEDRCCESELREGHCNFFVTRKRRYCKMTVGRGEKFCGEHRNLNMMRENDLFIRVQCPLDSKHSCYAHLLKKHLKKCNAGRKNFPEYVVKDINRGRSGGEIQTKLSLSAVEDDILSLLIQKVQMTGVLIVQQEVHLHPILGPELNNEKYSSSTRKHLLQNSSLLGHLLNLQFLKPDTCFIEFGAGRGQLSYWIGEAMSQTGMSCLLVPVDRANNRHKFDSRHRSDDLIKIHRLRVDIADLCLEKVPAVRESGKVVAVCKHLCGDATDLALRCLAHSDLDNVVGIIMAPCCHHRLDWDNYVGRDYFKEMEFCYKDFQLMSCLASWATCGQSNFNRGNVSKPVERFTALNIGPEECEDIGRRCKILFDYGRRRFLETIGFKCKMVYYTDRSVSPENMCLIAVKNTFSFDDFCDFDDFGVFDNFDDMF